MSYFLDACCGYCFSSPKLDISTLAPAAQPDEEEEEMEDEEIDLVKRQAGVFRSNAVKAPKTSNGGIVSANNKV